MGIASNYVKADLCLNDSQANIFPSLVFFWFLIFSVPMGMLMNRIGRKKTVLLSLLVTFVSQLLPIFGDSYPPPLGHGIGRRCRGTERSSGRDDRRRAISAIIYVQNKNR